MDRAVFKYIHICLWYAFQNFWNLNLYFSDYIVVDNARMVIKLLCCYKLSTIKVEFMSIFVQLILKEYLVFGRLFSPWDLKAIFHFRIFCKAVTKFYNAMLILTLIMLSWFSCMAKALLVSLLEMNFLWLSLSLNQNL